MSEISSSLTIVQKSEICISGIATFRRHSLPTQPRRREGEKDGAWLIK
jgi:hypothetical protein